MLLRFRLSQLGHFEDSQCHWWIEDYPEPGVILALADELDPPPSAVIVEVPGIGHEALWYPGTNTLIARLQQGALVIRLDGIYEYIIGERDGLTATRSIAARALTRLGEAEGSSERK